MVVPYKSDKSRFFLTFRGQWYLVITLEGVQKTHPRMAYCRIYQLIYPRHREGIFGASLVKVCKVHTNTPFSCLLLHHYSISQPLGVENLLIAPARLSLTTSVFIASTCSLERHREGCFFGVAEGSTFKQ